MYCQKNALKDLFKEMVMSKKARLSEEEREFFSLVNQAVFANPFSDERVAIDLKIAGLFPGVSERERIEKAIGRIAETIECMLSSISLSTTLIDTYWSRLRPGKLHSKSRLPAKPLHI
jgi:hypothetical protein